MPRLPTDYSNTIIYKIVCKNLEITDCYVGHTTDFRKRKWGHKTDLKRKKHPLQNKIIENGGWDNWDMIEIEKYPCKDANEAKARERYWYEELKAKLNGQSPLQTREDLLLRSKKYYENNKVVCINRVKEYTELHKEEKLEYLKNWRKEHKEEQMEKQKQKHECECGGRYSNNHKQRHFRTDKHKEYLANIIVGI